MKTIRTLLTVLLFGIIPAAAQEYTTRIVQVDEVDAIKAGSLIDVTKESSSATQRINSFFKKVFLGDYITGITYSGYNPGKELKRHIRVWVTNHTKGASNPVFDDTPVYDKDYTIPSGGTEKSPISLFALDFDSPYKLSDDLTFFFVKIECTGEAAEEQLCFEYNIENNRTVASFSVMSEVKYLMGTVCNQDEQPIAGAHVQLSTNQDGAKYGADTDGEGHYTVRVEESNRSYFVTLTASGFATYSGKGYSSSGIGNTVVTLKDTYTQRNFTLFDRICYKKDQRATIVLPITPNPEWGRYYRLDKRENENIIFEREDSPQANIPYVIFPNKDFELNFSEFDLSQEPGSIVIPYPDERSYPVPFVAMYGAYQNMDVPYIYTDQETLFLDETPDCETENEPFFGRIGACRAYLCMISPWPQKAKFVFANGTTGITDAVNKNERIIYDLQGRRVTSQPRRGVYIRDGKKAVVK